MADARQLRETPRGIIKNLLGQPGSAEHDRSKGKEQDAQGGAGRALRTPKTVISGSTRKVVKRSTRRETVQKKNETPRTLINTVLNNTTPASNTVDRSKAGGAKTAAEKRTRATPRNLLRGVLQNTTPGTTDRQSAKGPAVVTDAPSSAQKQVPEASSLETPVPSRASEQSTPASFGSKRSAASWSGGAGAGSPSLSPDPASPATTAVDEAGFAVPPPSLARLGKSKKVPENALVRMAKLRARTVPTLTPRKSALAPSRSAFRSGSSLARSLADTKSSSKTKRVGLPSSFTKSVFGQFAKMPLAKTVGPALDECMNDFFRQLAGDLHSYSKHGKHEGHLSVADVRCLIKRQRRVVGAGSRSSLEAICHELLPLEYTDELIPIARVGNTVSLG